MRNLRLAVLGIVLLGAAAWVWLASETGEVADARTANEPTVQADVTPTELAAPARAAVTERKLHAADARAAAAGNSTAEPAPAQLTVRARFVDEYGSACADESIAVSLSWQTPGADLTVNGARSMANTRADTDAAGDLVATLAAPSGDALLHVANYTLPRALTPLDRKVTLVAGDNQIDLGVLEMQTRLPVSARVVDEAGLPFLGASIFLRGADIRQTASVSAPADQNLAKGYALPGSYTVQASRGGAVLSPLTLEVPRDTTALVEVVMRRETTLSGIVRDAAGQPVPAVTVFVEDLDDPAARAQIPTSRDGTFTLRGGARPPGQQGRLWVFSGGRYALADGAGTPSRLPVTWGAKDLVVRLVSWTCTARVRVVRASDRQPLTAYRLWLDPPAEVRARYPDAFAGWLPGATQHPDGVVTLPNVVPDLQTLLVVPDDRALALTAHALHAKIGENSVEIAVAAAPETIVHCFGPSGEPLDTKLELLVDEGDVSTGAMSADIRVTPPGAWKRPPTRWRHDSTTAATGRGVLHGGQIGQRALVHAPDLGLTVPVTLAACAEVTLMSRGAGELVVRFTDREFTSLAPLLLALPHGDGKRASATIEAERVTLRLAAGTYDLHLSGDEWSPMRTPSLARVEVTTERAEVTLDGIPWRPGVLRWRAPGDVQFHSRGGPTLTKQLSRTPGGFTETALLPGEYDAVGQAGVARVRIAAGATQELELELAPSPFVLVLRHHGAPVVGRGVVWVAEGGMPGMTPPLGKSDAAGRVPVVTGAPPRSMRLMVEGVAQILGPFDWPEGPELVVELPN